MTNAARATHWWRFDHYRIADGILRPAPHARLQRFDPWTRFREVEGQYRTVDTLWGEFAELTRQLQQDMAPTGMPSPRGQKMILDWCQRYGLLGLLPAKALIITLPPHYESSLKSLGYSFQPQQALRATVRPHYGRFAGYWFADTQISGDPLGPPFDWEPGQAAPFKAGEEHHDTVCREWIDPSLSIHTEASSKVLSRYFPPGMPAYQYPAPLSEEFWHLYQEPLDEWLQAARVFVESMQLVSDQSAGLCLGEPMPANSKGRLAAWTLNSLAEAEAVYYDFGPDGIKEDAASGSLLSAMTKMFFYDLIAKRRLLHCAVCGRVFISNDLKAQYCKAGCRNLAQTRRYRSRVKALRQR